MCDPTMGFAVVFFVLLWVPSFGQHLADEAIYTINGIKVLHTVNEKFVSFSIDPAVLLTGLNLSNTTLRMAKRLAPAFVRIAGPSTQFVRYEDENYNDLENGHIVVTPTMWFGINEWLLAANLTPVFGINDADAGKDGWDPQEAMEVLDLADKFNVSCYWQLGFDCSNKSGVQYGTDLRRLKHVLDAFPKRTAQWKVVGSDLTRCVSDARKSLDDLEDVLAAVILEHTSTSENPFLPHLKPKVPIWVTSPKSSHPASFDSALSWAKHLGEAAKNGFEVILRQPRLHEIYSESPPFWISALHKMLVGRNVLDAKTTTLHPELSLYAHCTKNQNDFIRSGAMTVLVVNNCTSNHTVFLKFGSLLLKSTEVQSYIVTGDSEDATQVYLNGERLSLDRFDGDQLNIAPKLRRARIVNYLSLFLPPKSVGFFVLPGAQIPVCVNEEPNMDRLLEEIREDQNIQFSRDDISVEVNPRSSLHRSPTLRELQNVMEKELESDERYYKQMKKKTRLEKNDGRNLLIQRVRDKMEAAKLEEPKRMEPLKLKSFKKEEPKKIFDLELTSAEIRKVLSDRAKVKASKKNIIFTSEELDEIMGKATKKFLNDKNTEIRVRKKSKREVGRDKKDINMRLLKLKAVGGSRKVLREALKNRRARLHTSPPKRERRDINMELLKIKTEQVANNKHKKLKKPFSIKEFSFRKKEKPDEIVESEEDEEEKQSNLPNKDVYAELAESDEYQTTTTEKIKIVPKKRPLSLRKFNLPKIQVEPLTENIKDQVYVSNDFEAYAHEDDNDDDYDCFHEFRLKPKDEVQRNSTELWEVGLELIESTRDSPRVQNRLLDYVKFKTGIGNSESDDADCMDYGDLESDEINPVRLRRDVVVENILGKTYDPSNIKIDEDLKDQQFRLLKEHLQQKKKVDFINRNSLMLNQRKTRSLFQKNHFKERYKSLTDGLKKWRPSDVLTLQRPKKNAKRSVDHDVESVENDIGEFINEWMKDAPIVKPQLDMEHGDYQLVFPNKDKLEVAENKGDTEVRLVLYGETTEKAATENTTRTNIQKISKEQSGNVWKRLFRKLSKFFQGLSNKLKTAIMENIFKSN